MSFSLYNGIDIREIYAIKLLFALCYIAEPAVNKASSRFHQYPDRSDGDKPDGDQPGGDRPGEDRPSGDRPSGGGSGGGGRGSGGGRPGGEGGERPGGGGRQRRQTKGGREMEPATCTNSECEYI